MSNLISFEADVRNSLPRMIDENEIKSKELAEDLFVSPALVTRWSKGDSKLKSQYFEQMLLIFKHPSMLVFDYMNQTTHMIPPIANGPKLRKQLDTYAGQLIDELKEATLALKNSMDEFRSDGEVDLRDPTEVVRQIDDVIFFGQTLKSFMESEYGIDLRSEEKQRELYWKKEGYLATR